jgi:hypothetical protein
MTIFDLVFIALVLVTVVMLIGASVAAVRGRRTRARVTLRRLGIILAAYSGALLLASALTPQRVLGIGDDQCSDDWCIAVQAVHIDTTTAGIRYSVTFRLANRARRVAQRERFVVVYARDARMRQHMPVVDPGAVPFDTLLQPGEAILADRRFLVAAQAPVVGLVIAREGGGRFPGCCIIGDEASLFHRRTIVRLDAR